MPVVASPCRILPRLSIPHCIRADRMFDTEHDYLCKAIIAVQQLRVTVSRERKKISLEDRDINLLMASILL